MSPAPASSPANFRVTLSGFPFDVPGTWAQKGGGDTTGSARRWHEGGDTKRERVAGGQATTSDVTVTRHYIRDRDGAVLRKARRYANRAFGMMSQQPLDEDDNPYGKAEVFRVLLTGVNGPPVNADDADGFSDISLILAIDGESA